jgi:hypothetical protein
MNGIIYIWELPPLDTCCSALLCDGYYYGFVTPVMHIYIGAAHLCIGASIRVGSMRVPALLHSCC